jgi:hypothetical protein
MEKIPIFGRNALTSALNMGPVMFFRNVGIYLQDNAPLLLRKTIMKLRIGCNKKGEINMFV